MNTFVAAERLRLWMRSLQTFAFKGVDSRFFGMPERSLGSICACNSQWYKSGGSPLILLSMQGFEELSIILYLLLLSQHDKIGFVLRHDRRLRHQMCLIRSTSFFG